MRLASRNGVGFLEKNTFRWFRLRKRTRQWIRFRPGMDKTVIFIVGCQRSGTSMVHHLLRQDWDSVTYDETSPLSTPEDPMGMRWRPLSEVRECILADRAPLVVTKPLVESQHLDKLLDLHSSTRALWVFRPFRDVARSNVRYFGQRNSHQDLAPLLAGDLDDWRVELMDSRDLAAVRDLYRPDMEPYDAAALFWYARNSHFFARGFDKDDRVKLCFYDDLVIRPSEVMRQVYGFIGREYPGDRILGDVFRDSRGKGRELDLDPEVARLCQKLLGRLLACPRLDGFIS